MTQTYFDLSSTERTRFDDGNYVYELHNHEGKLIIDIHSMCSTIQKAKLININVPDTIDYCINLHRCFYNHHELSDLSALKSFDTSHVVDMSEMFYGCRALTDCDSLSSWDVSNVTDMSYMFYCCHMFLDFSAIESWNISSKCELYKFYHLTRIPSTIYVPNFW